jgi:hypothetical protein
MTNHHTCLPSGCEACEAEHKAVRQQDNTRLNRLSPRERYHRDPWFRQLVDLLGYHLDRPEVDANFTPTELREAVILAATRHEELRRYRNRDTFLIPRTE